MSLGFSIGLRALVAARTAMNTIGHNLANQNTPGYSRQIALLQTTSPAQGPGLTMLGTGVGVSSIYTSVNESLLFRIRTEAATLGQSGAESSLLGEMEAYLGDLTGNGIASIMQGFFDSASQASTAPEDMVLRQNFLSAADAIAVAFQTKSGGLQSLRNSTLQQADGIVTHANSLLHEVADLNLKIKTQEAIGDSANDLRDRRTVVMQGLSELIGAQGQSLPDGTMNVSIAGATLVTGDNATEIHSVSNGNSEISLSAGNGAVDLKNVGGQLGGVMDVLENFLPDRLQDLDDIAHGLIASANRVHSKGVPSTGPFSSLLGAYSIKTPELFNPLTLALSDAGLPFEMKAGSLSIAVTDEATGDVQRTELQIDPDLDSIGSLLNSLNSVPHLSATLDGSGKLKINADSGYGFDFSKKVDANPVDGGTFGATAATAIGDATFPVALTAGDQFSVSVDGGPAQTVTINPGDFQDINAATADEVAAVLNGQIAGTSATVVDGRVVLASNTDGENSTLALSDVTGAPLAILGLPAGAAGAAVGAQVTVTGAPTSDVAANYTFKAVGDGDVGVTPDLAVEVYDDNGFLIDTISVGEGYEPGSEVEIADGVFVSFSPGAIQGSANQFFDVELPGDTDTSDVLVAFGLNAMFKGSDASTIAVADQIAGKPDQVAGALFGGPGDGGNYLQLAGISDLAVDSLGGSTLGSSYNAFAATIGTEAASAQSTFESSSLVLLTLETQRAAESGVNPDEEILMLEQYQLAYEAAAKFISTISELEQTLLDL